MKLVIFTIVSILVILAIEIILRVAFRTKQEKTLGIPTDKAYDFFISYKVENVGIVRPIVEQMIASGLKVWFDEYMIDFKGRDQPERAFSLGAQKSRLGICFTNDKYFGSSNCLKELALLMDVKNCGLQNIIEIRLPAKYLPLQKYPALAESQSIEYRDVNETLDFIRRFSRLSIIPMEALDSSIRTTSIFQYNGKTYSLDLAGWDVTHQKSSQPDEDGDVKGPRFQRWCGQNRMFGHLLLGKQDLHVSRLIRSEDYQEYFDDRKYFKDAVEFANVYYRKIWRQKGAGIHLVFLPDFSQHSQIAFTTLFGPKVWSRLYSIIVPDQTNNRDKELAFFFFFEGEFQGFCRHAYLMDKVVSSLKEDGVSLREGLYA